MFFLDYILYLVQLQDGFIDKFGYVMYCYYFKYVIGILEIFSVENFYFFEVMLWYCIKIKIKFIFFKVKIV